MVGTLVNIASIILCGFLGLLIKGGIPERFSSTIMSALGLAVTIIGISGSLKSENTILIIISLALGAFVGELMDIDKGINHFANYVEGKFKSFKGSNFAQGFITSTLLFCVGTMAIMGSIESGLNGNHEILFTKSVLDGISSMIFSSSLGIGVLFSSIPVLLYQGSITLASGLLKAFLSTEMIREISAVGSILILALGLNMLGICKIKVANLLPAIIIPVSYYIIFVS